MLGFRSKDVMATSLLSFSSALVTLQNGEALISCVPKRPYFISRCGRHEYEKFVWYGYQLCGQLVCRKSASFGFSRMRFSRLSGGTPA